MAKDILINENGELLFENGDFKIGESTIQEIDMLLRLNQGGLKSDPILGPNLIDFVKSNGNIDQAESKISQHLKMDNKDYKELKHLIKIK